MTITEKFETNIFQPSGLNSAFTYPGSSFTGYISYMRDIIERVRPDLNEENAELIIDSNGPFEWVPQHSSAYNPVTKKIKRGILLIHGLFDSPCSMQSISEYFRKQNYLVRGLLLPGHGTIPGDLLNISYHEWIKSTEFAIETFANQVDELFICGYSTGGTLAIHYALQNPAPFLRGLILIAPAIKLRHQFSIISNINNLIRKTIGGVAWYIKQENLDYAKYQSLNFESAHQVYLLTRVNDRWLKKNTLEIPIFISATINDEILNPLEIVRFFQNTPHKNNHCIIYSPEFRTFEDQRIELRKSSYPEKNIINFSHISLPIGTDHFHYGKKGDFKDFLHYRHPIGKRYRSRLEKEAFETTYYGAITTQSLAKYHLQRLTYNPDFDYMIDKINQFIDKEDR